MICTTTTTKKNLGKSKCTALPKLFKRMIWTPANFRLAAADYADAAALKTALQDLIKNPINSRGYLFPDFSSIEEMSEEAQYVDTPLSYSPVRDGNYRWKIGISHNLCTHLALFSHRSINEGRVIFMDVDNQLFLCDPDDDGNLAGFSLQLLWTEKLKISTGADLTESPIVVALKDNEEIDKHGVLLEEGQVVNTLEPLTDVTITSVSQAAATIIVDVKQSCDGTPVSGLLLADFLLYAVDGITLQLKQAVTEDIANNNPGRYTITAPGGNDFEDGSLTLRAPSALTVEAYEAEAALAINV